MIYTTYNPFSPAVSQNEINFFKQYPFNNSPSYLLCKAPHEIVCGIYSSDRFENKVVLTFDDGPSKYTEQVLNILKKYNIKTVFFINGCHLFDDKGQIIVQRVNLLRRMIMDGHVIGNHTYGHENLGGRLYKTDLIQIERAFLRNQQAVDKVLGFHYEMDFLRPPGGNRGKTYIDLPGIVDKAIADMNKAMVLWQVDPADMTKHDHNISEVDAAYRLLFITHGGVVLFHDTHYQIARDLSYLIEKIKNKTNYTFTGLDTLFKDKYEAK